MSKKKPLSKQIGLWDNASNIADQQQRDNAYGEVKRCLNSDSELLKLINKKEVQIYEHGSFDRNSDVTGASDLDMHVAWQNGDILKLKDYIENLLAKQFGRGNVERKSLTIKVKGHGNRMTTDILPCKFIDDSKVVGYSEQIKREIDFYPNQDVSGKNALDGKTANNYSRMVRSFKGLKHEMHKSGIVVIPSFMIECLLYNISESIYLNSSYAGMPQEQKYLKMFVDTKNAIFSQQLKSWEEGKQWLEINGKKPLFFNEGHFNRVVEFFSKISPYIKNKYTYDWKD